jgi:hypothetical protein
MMRAMIARSIACLALLASCGSDDDPAMSDAGDPGDGDGDGDGDAGSLPTETLVTGTLDGESFTMTHAAMIWMDQLHMICVSTAPVMPVNDCADGVGARTLLRGIWGTNDNQTGVWSAIQTELRRLDSATDAVEVPWNGTIAIDVIDPDANRFVGAIELEFESGPLRGVVVIP